MDNTGDITEKFTFLDLMMQGYYNYGSRDKRLVVTGPIAISIAIGLFSTFTTVAASIAISKEEGNRVSREQNAQQKVDADIARLNDFRNNEVSVELGKVADFLKYTTAVSAQTATNFHDVETLQLEVSFMFKREKVLSFDDPQTEQFFSAIEEMVTNNTRASPDPR